VTLVPVTLKTFIWLPKVSVLWYSVEVALSPAINPVEYETAKAGSTEIRSREIPRNKAVRRVMF
jgi:hypothetical protein